MGRLRIPLIAGRPLDGLARFAVVADSANGLSAPLDSRDWLFIPPGVTMHLLRYPAGEWVRLTARSGPGHDGVGLSDGTLSDAAGPCGTVTQSLLVAPRTATQQHPPGPARRFDDEQLRSAAVAFLTYTSSATGSPEGAMTMHGNIVFDAQAYRDWVGIGPRDDQAASRGAGQLPVTPAPVAAEPCAGPAASPPRRHRLA